MKKILALLLTLPYLLLADGAYVNADWLWVHQSESNKILVTDNSTSNTLLDINDIGYNFETGARIYAGYQMGCFSLEGGYLFNDWNASRSISGSDNLDAVAGTIDYTQADDITAYHDSKLRNYEINLWYNMEPDFKWFYGARVTNLNTSFNMESTDSGQTSNYNIKSDNTLYGVQGGLNWKIPYCWGFSTVVDGRIGVYYNDAEMNVRFEDNGALALFDHGCGHVAFSGDLNGALVYQPSHFIKLRIGYLINWIGQTANAGYQFQNDITGISPNTDLNFGHVFMHGAFCGLELKY